MNTIYGTVLSKEIDVDIKNREGGFYKGYRIVYKNQDGEIRPLEKAMQSLKYSPSVDAALRSITVGDEITIVQEKNGKGYLDVKAIQKGHGETPIAVEASSVPRAEGIKSNANATGGFPIKAYEDRRQTLIVRQSAINQALEYFRVGYDGQVDGDLTTQRVFDVAQEFEDWVNR
jgi:hypothetical protein